MNSILWALLATFGWGIAYYVGAIPIGVGMGLHPIVAALAAWSGYTAIAAAMLLIGTPAREWIRKKFKISTEPDPKKLIWRIWLKAGLPGLAFLAPVTIGPYAAALIALTMGERPARVIFWIAIAVIPCTIFLTIVSATGAHLLGK